MKGLLLSYSTVGREESVCSVSFPVPFFGLHPHSICFGLFAVLPKLKVAFRAAGAEGPAPGVLGPDRHWLGRSHSQRFAAVPDHLGGLRRRADWQPADGYCLGGAFPVAGHRLQHPGQMQAPGMS